MVSLETILARQMVKRNVSASQRRPSVRERVIKPANKPSRNQLRLRVESSMSCVAKINYNPPKSMKRLKLSVTPTKGA